MAWFAANRQRALPPFDKGLPIVHARRDPAPAEVGRYVLECDGTLRLWAQIYAFRRSFATYEIVLGGPAWDQSLEDPLATLVSAVAINSKADLLILAPADEAMERSLDDVAWGECRRVLVLDPSHRLIAGRYVNLWRVDPAVWWETPHGKVTRQRLAYLEKRVERRPAFQQTRRQSLIERLFNIGRPKK